MMETKIYIFGAYEGEMNNGRRNGRGIMKYNNGGKYDG